MAIWATQSTPQMLNDAVKMTLAGNLGIEFMEIGDDYLKARMPVDHRTRTPFERLHGGASAAFAETVGGTAANLSVDRSKKLCVGLSITANHIRAAKEGVVYGVAKPVHRGRFTQVWDIQIRDEEDELVCVSRLTVAVIDVANE